MNFQFISPDREPVIIDLIEKYIKMAEVIRSMQIPKCQKVGIPINSNLNIVTWERYLQRCPEDKLLLYLIRVPIGTCEAGGCA